MSPTVRLSCPGCGDIVVTAEMVTVTLAWTGDATWHAVCPHCGHGFGRDCRPCTAGLLVAAGAVVGPYVARSPELDDRDRARLGRWAPLTGAYVDCWPARAERNLDAALANLLDQERRR